MNVWIYDENSYPSGFAGGLGAGADARVARPRAGLPRGQAAAPSWATTSLARLPHRRQTASRTSRPRPGPASRCRKGRYLVGCGRAGRQLAVVRRTVLRGPAVSRRDARSSSRSRWRPIAARSATSSASGCPAVHRRAEHPARPAGCPGPTTCPQQFQKRWGYSLLDHLASLSRPVGDWKQVRHNYFQVLLDLFIERWAKPYYDYCEKHDLEFTGHYWEHDWPNCIGVPDNMAMYAWQQRPGIDSLMNQYQRGHPRPVRQRADGQGALQRGQPARPQAHARAKPTAPAAGTCASRT